jgi:hypothetical protein
MDVKLVPTPVKELPLIEIVPAPANIPWFTQSTLTLA